jgi:hypothetical protein
MSHNTLGRISWDLFVMFLIITISIIMPVHLAFVEDESDADKNLTLLISVSDFLLLLDIFINFVTTYDAGAD